MSLQVEESVDYPTLLRLNSNGRIDDIRWGPAYSAGTRVWIRVGEIWHAYLVTDLTASERIVGQASVTINANVTTGVGTATLASPLADTVLTNYRLFATIDGNSPTNAWIAALKLNSVTQLQIRVARANTIVTSSLTGLTVGAGDLTDIDVLVGGQNPHGADAGLFGHAHTTTGHPVTDPGHIHTEATNQGAATFNVDYLIWHV